jgi:protein involved in polysaccharide export with SLBB domain
MHRITLKLRVVALLAGWIVLAPGKAESQTVSIPNVPPPARSESSPLRVGDVMRIRVWPDSSLGGDYPVEETGLVHLPLVGAYSVAGRSIASIREELRGLYEKELKSPVVTVTPIFRVSVLGAVQRPGLYFADPTQTWFDVISNAGGFSNDADRHAVRILRDGKTIRINATTEELSADQSLDIAVQSGDRILVPSQPTSRLPLILGLAQTAILIAVGVHQLHN